MPDQPFSRRPRAFFSVMALGYTIVVVLVAIVSVAGSPEGDQAILIQLGTLTDDSTTYQWGFVLATLLPVFLLPLTAGVAFYLRPAAARSGDTTSPSGPGLGAVGALFVAAYAPLSALAYATQYTVFPNMLAKNFQEAEVWYFGAHGSLPLTVDMLAYALFGVGALLIAVPMLGERGALSVAAWSLAVSGALSIAAFALYALDVDLGGAVSLVSAAFSVAFALAVLLVVHRRPKLPVSAV
jgi:hypothetical protein